MNHVSRRTFIKTAASLVMIMKQNPAPFINTVSGKIAITSLGTSLIHEHFLVDFIGADKTNENRWNKDEVVKKVFPYLLEVKKFGVKTIFDCTPAFLGRDVLLQKHLADESGLQVITNTGYYGAMQNKYLPQWAFTEGEERLAQRWINEFENGIDGTAIKPGFIKIGVDALHLSALHQKLVKSAAITHLKTGLTICSHTGPAVAAFEELDILKTMNVHPSAFVWTHAQVEKNKSLHVNAARMGTWISLDGLGWGEVENYADSITNLRSAGLLDKVLISHDAGWYKPDEKDGGSFTGFTNIFTQLLPLLQKKGFTENDITRLLVKNPAEAFGTRIRKLA